MVDFNTNGCIHNPEYVEEVVSQMANPFFASAAPAAAGSGKNKLILLHENFKKLKLPIPPPLQTSVGDCFNPSSLVSMADGSKKRLDKVVVGDLVITPFGTTKVVLSVFKKPYTGHMLEISTKFSRIPLVCTPDHKIWHDNNWTRAESLYKQFRILSPDSGGYSEIESIQKVKPETNFVYCIEVEDDHAFICDGYAVHNCVSHACATALDYLCVTEIANGEREQWVSRIASEFIYSNGRVIIGKGRLGGGDGSLNAWTLKAMKELGTLVRQKYGRVDLSEYSPARARSWGNTKVPQTLLDISKDFFITGYKLISNFEEAMDALASGCPIVVASNQGFTKKRDKDGFCSPSGSWSHSMAIIGGDSTGKRPGVAICNSWPGYLSGPNPYKLPESTFMCDADVFNKMAKSYGDTFALFGYNGHKLLIDNKVWT